MTRAIRKPAWWLWAALGVTAGLGSLRLALLPPRWIVAALMGLWVLMAALWSGQPRRIALLAFTLSLQIGLALYLTSPPAASSVGASWPNSLALPLASVTALAALATRRPGAWTWGGPLAGAAVLVALTTLTSLSGSPERWIGFSHLVLVGAYYLVLLAAANTVHDSADLELVLRGLLVSLLVQSLLYFVQSLVGGTFTPAGDWIEPADSLGRYGGTVGARPAMFSSFLLPLLLVAVTQLLTASDPGLWFRCGMPAAAGAAALILTFTRASWIGFALGLFYLLAAGRRRKLLAPRRVRALVGLLLLLTLALSPKILMRVAEDHGAAFDERWALIQMAARVIHASPLTGVGAGAYPFVFRDYLTPELADKWLYVVHNVYVLRAAETGLPGLAAWLLFLTAAFRMASPERMTHPLAVRLALGWRAGLVGLGWEMLWDVSLGPAANGLLWFLCGLTWAAARLRERRP